MFVLFFKQTQHERFLMKKNIRDFRTFAQTLAMNKKQRKNYMKVNKKDKQKHLNRKIHPSKEEIPYLPWGYPQSPAAEWLL